MLLLLEGRRAAAEGNAADATAATRGASGARSGTGGARVFAEVGRRSDLSL
jgi:hypothetical protein